MMYGMVGSVIVLILIGIKYPSTGTVATAMR